MASVSLGTQKARIRMCEGGWSLWMVTVAILEGENCLCPLCAGEQAREILLCIRNPQGTGQEATDSF